MFGGSSYWRVRITAETGGTFSASGIFGTSRSICGRGTGVARKRVRSKVTSAAWCLLKDRAMRRTAWLVSLALVGCGGAVPSTTVTPTQSGATAAGIGGTAGSGTTTVTGDPTVASGSGSSGNGSGSGSSGNGSGSGSSGNG